jgi:site-specific recombinase XerD
MSHPTKYQISDENKQTIEEYLKDVKIEKELSDRTISNKRYLLWALGGFLKDKSFLKTTEEDLKQFFTETTYKGGGKEPLKVEVISFYKWLYKTD